MKDKIGVAVYTRVDRAGQHEQNAPALQENKIPTPEKLVAEGHDVITLPKKKAWLFIWSSLPMNEETRKLKTEVLKDIAESEGYEVIGQMETIGREKAVEDAMMKLLEIEPPVHGANAIYIKGIKVIALGGYGKALAIYDKLQEKGIELRASDGSIQAFDNDKGFLRSLLQNMSEAETESEEQSWGEIPTQTM